MCIVNANVAKSHQQKMDLRYKIPKYLLLLLENGFLKCGDEHISELLSLRLHTWKVYCSWTERFHVVIDTLSTVAYMQLLMTLHAGVIM